MDSEKPSKRRVVVVLNERAGTEDREKTETQLQDLFSSHGIEAHILRLDGSNGVSTLLQDLPENATVVAGGGDGTISAVAGELVGTKRVLAVLPLGTLNHFAKDLGIPTTLEDAVATIARGEVRTVDVGEVNGRIFLNNSGLGIYPQVVAERENEQRQKGSGKWPAFVRAMIGTFRRFPFLDLQFCADGETRHLRTAFIMVGNNEYEISGPAAGGRERLDRGRLVFYVTHQTGRLGLFRLALHALFGRLHRAADFSAMHIREAEIHSRKRTLLVSADGEVARMTPPLVYRIRPNALRVLVPRKEGES